MFKDLKTMRGSYAVRNIKDYPSGLSKLYDHKMSRIENAETKLLQHCRDGLVATSIAYRPLSLCELAVLVPWSDETDPCTIIEECDSLSEALPIQRSLNFIRQRRLQTFPSSYASSPHTA